MKIILFYFTVLFSIQIYSQDNCEIVKSTTLKDYATKKYSSNPIEGTEIIKIEGTGKNYKTISLNDLNFKCSKFKI